MGGIELLQVFICLSIIMILTKFKPNIIEILRSFTNPLHTADDTNACFRFRTTLFLKQIPPEEYFCCICTSREGRRREKNKHTKQT